ncbi:MAG: hypothetical protein CMH57_08220 [Myxococcales bacterium]|nr:hypothetical protein [Myxococcales bacterium]
MRSLTRKVTLDIGGERLSLRTDRDEASLNALAEEVTARVDALREAAPHIPIQQVYLLVALQFAEDLREEQINLADLQQELSSRTSRIVNMLDAELRSSS